MDERLKAAPRDVRDHLAQNPEAQIRVVETISRFPEHDAVPPNDLGRWKLFVIVIRREPSGMRGDASYGGFIGIPLRAPQLRSLQIEIGWPIQIELVGVR